MLDTSVDVQALSHAPVQVPVHAVQVFLHVPVQDVKQPPVHVVEHPVLQPPVQLDEQEFWQSSAQVLSHPPSHVPEQPSQSPEQPPQSPEHVQLSSSRLVPSQPPPHPVHPRHP